MKTEDVKKLSPEERLLYWINERESIRRKKALGLPAPWTDDEILQTYRFCNVRRMDDKVSDWLLRNWYRPYRDHENTVVAVALARMFNLPSTLLAIQKLVYQDGTPDWQEVISKVQQMRAIGNNVFNGAYVVSTSGNKADKVEWVVTKYVQPLVSINVPGSSLQDAVTVLAGCYGFSTFMAGQVAADLRWAMSGVWSDRNTWAAIGPGSRRGMNRLKERPVEAPLRQEQFTEELQEIMERLGSKLSKDLTKRLEAIDYQNCLCEYDKYNRVLLGEGRPKQLYKAGEGL